MSGVCVLLQRLGPDVREGKRRQFNYIGMLSLNSTSTYNNCCRIYRYRTLGRIGTHENQCVLTTVGVELKSVFHLDAHTKHMLCMAQYIFFLFV